MKMYLDGILVVEGKEDASYLSNYISSEIVVVNGFELAGETISYLKNKKTIILTDPDEAGQKIRELLNKELENPINIEVDITKCNRGTKNGVAECQIDEIISKLHKYVKKENISRSDIKMSDLYNLGLINHKELRNAASKKLNLGICNSKTFYKRLIMNNVSLEQLCEIIKERQHGNK